MICKICNSKTETAFIVKVLQKYDATYLKCSNCGFLFAKNPFWLDEAYNSPITYSDTGLVTRNLLFAKITSVLIDIYFDKCGKFLDFAGGYGLFTRLMRDYGFDFYWTDKYCENLFARGFELEQIKNQKIELLSAFEVFEHLVDPSEEFKKMASISNNIIFSTELLPDPIPNPGEWWYYIFEHGQHISFYTKKSLTVLAKQHNLNFYSMKGIHLITEKKLNETMLKILKVMSLYFLSNILRIRRKSKTFSDHLNIIDTYRNKD